MLSNMCFVILERMREEKKKKMTEREELSCLLVVLVLQVFSVLHCYDVCNWHYVLM